MQQDFLDEIMADESNAEFTNRGWQPLFTASESSRIVVIGQAPGIKAQTSGVPWDDKSGQKLIEWLGINEAQFRDPRLYQFYRWIFIIQAKANQAICHLEKILHHDGIDLF